MDEQEGVATERRFLDAAAISGAEDKKTLDVDMQKFGWGGWVKIRGITSAERAAIEKRLTVRKGKDKELNTQYFREWLIVYGTIDENGRQLLQSEHVQMLTQKSSAAVQHLAEAIMALSGMSDTDVEELVGNSPSAPSPA